jgi:hypothetical protein
LPKLALTTTRLIPARKLFISGDFPYIAPFFMKLPPKTVIFLRIRRTGRTTLQRIPERNFSVAALTQPDGDSTI